MNKSLGEFFRKHEALISLILLLFFSFLRLALLEADPSILRNNIVDMGDEGYWSHDGRMAALFGEWISDDFNQALATAPLYALISYITYMMTGGVDLFTTRIPSVIAGIATVWIVFFIVRRYNNKLAVIAAFFLSIDERFFLDTRIGHLEPIAQMFFMFSFFYLTRTNRKHADFTFAGIFLALSILTKLTSIYFLLPLSLYFLTYYLRKEIKVKEMFYFVIGLALVTAPVFLFYYIPNYETLQLSLGLLGKISESSFSNFFYLLYERFFASPSVYLLLILLIVYCKKRNLLTFFTNIKSNLKKLDDLEVIAFSWILGYSVAIILSDISERRFTLFLVPIALLAAMVFDPRKKLEFEGDSKINFISFLLLMVPILNLLGIAFWPMLLPALTDIPTQTYETYSLGIVGVLSLVLYILLFRRKLRKQNLLDKIIPKIALVCYLFGLSFILCFYLALTLNGGFWIAQDPYYPIIIALVFIFFILLSSDRIKLKKHLEKIYIGLNIVFLSCVLLFPIYSIRDASQRVGSLCDEGEWVIGPWVHELVLENKLKPLLWQPNAANNGTFNRNVTIYKPKYFTLAVEEYGNPVGPYSQQYASYPTKDQAAALGNLVYLDRFELFPVFGKPRLVLELYRIDYA